MEGVHSYEQRSSSSDDHNGANFNQNRIVISDRRSDSKNSTSLQSDLSLKFESNEWKTSKYTLLNFLPKNLFEQFRRLANFYFLASAILQLIIPFSPVGPLTSLLPLLFVISTTAFKQAYEDYLRHKVDKEVNNRSCHVLKDKKLIKIRSKDIKVGDIVYVKNNEEIPCDMILLATSGLGDRCYVTTANLDGETSLKSRTCFHIKEKLGSIDELDKKLLLVECEKPNATLYEFNGYLRSTTTAKYYNRSHSDNEKFGNSATSTKLHSSSSIVNSIFEQSIRKSKLETKKLTSDRKQSDANKLFKYLNADSNNDILLDISNLLLRASRLKNTSFIYGLAIYTGRDTKLALNSHVKANKFSSIEKRVNLFLFIAFAILIVFTLTTSTLRYNSLSYWHIDKQLTKSDSFEKILVSHFLLYNYLVPISLYVTLEFIKFFSTTSVVEDKKMQVEVWQSINVDKSTTTTSNHLTDSHFIIPKTHQLNYNNYKSVTSVNNLNESGHKKLKSKTSVTSMKRTRVVVSPKCNSSDLNEELGQVEVLFSDKTGTLTENKMKFKACSIQGSLYRSIMGKLYLQPFNSNIIPNVAKKLSTISTHRYTQLSNINQTVHSKRTQKASPGSSIKTNSHSSCGPHYSKLFDFGKVSPLDELKTTGNLDEREELAKFFTCLCLCSTLTLNETLPLKDCLPDKTNNEYNFQAASPDEESLISAAQLFGLTMCKSNEQECFIVIERTTATNNNNNNSSSSRKKKAKSNSKSTSVARSGKFKALVETKNSNDKYLIRHFNRLMVLEFDSTRKRMSVIYRDCDNDCIIVVSKGSEEMLDCIDMKNLNQNSNYENCINTTMAHFDAFSKFGLRTLLIAWRYLNDFEFNKISNEMREAKLSTQDRDYQTNKLYHKIETNMKLIGATAVEDTLQDGVPETIENLRFAGIKIWLLTGDKVETAISVAYLCKLLDNEMILFYLVRQQDVKACKELLLFYNNKLNNIMKENEEEENKKISKFALVADGRSFHYAMKYAKQEFKQLSKQCNCVLGCRLSPLQKAEVVELIKNSDERPITLAIGDGANDVSMIQEAHVGIGVFGKEGRQAVNSSDFAIGRFNLLNRLLFVHGHLFYHRTSNTIHYFFYKNLIFILPQFLYSFYNFSSATTLYHPILLVSFNLFFTSLPILIYGLYEVYIPENILECFPKLYKINRNTNQLRTSVFICWLILATIQASIGFYLLYFSLGNNTPFIESGKIVGINSFSLILYFVIVITVTIKLYLITRSNSIYFILAAIISCLSLPAFFFIYSLFDW